MNRLTLCFLFLSILMEFIKCSASDIFNFSSPSACGKEEYFSTVSFKCLRCDGSNHLYPSTDKLSCTCNSRSVITGWDPKGFPRCTLCPSNQVPSSDRRFCLSCLDMSGKKDIPAKCKCAKDYITVERHLNGSSSGTLLCVKCAQGTWATLDQKVCAPCPSTNLNCSCIPSPGQDCVEKVAPTSGLKGSDAFEIEYDMGKVEFPFLKEYLQSVAYRCKVKSTSHCQALANLCVFSMYSDTYPRNPCRIYKELLKTLPATNDSFPIIFFPEGEAHSVLYKKTILQHYRFDSTSQDSYLNIVLNQWDVNGTWLGFTAGENILNLCSFNGARRPLFFTLDHKIKCRSSVQEIYNRRNVELFDVYLKYEVNNQSYIHSIPILNQNYKLRNKYPNKLSDTSQWVLTRRIFMIDRALVQKEKDSYPQTFRYLKTVTLRVNVRAGGEGVINTPLLILTYDEVSQEDMMRNKIVTLGFNVEYRSSDYTKHNLDIALGVLCSLSALWSFMRTWSYIKRSGQKAVDLVVVLHLCIVGCGHLSNVFFFVSCGTAVQAFIYYKWQTVPFVLLPSAKMLYLVRLYTIVAFPLKVLEIVAMMWYHMTIDIFLIDWEQPRVQKQTMLSVSAWRTYFVGNKWNEIQTIRKTSLLLQSCAVIFFLKICKMENWATRHPGDSSSSRQNFEEVSEDKVFRLAVGVTVYILVYIAQWATLGVLYERYVKNPIQEFVDICSLANISVFMLSLQNYGFYVHGRSAHGFSDTDMATLRCQLKREEEDLVGHRGLLPASDHQTFQILIPPKLKTIYKSFLINITKELPLSVMKKQGKGLSAGTISDNTMLTYVTINRFLAAFIEHALKDLDYEVRDKLFMEALFDLEFLDYSTKGVFFNDNGHSFDNVLYYGNELTLFTFDLILFSFIEILAQNYLLAVVVTLLCGEGIARIRKFWSSKNLAKKALIDECFLL